MPWVIHRAIFGSFERFIGVLLEHTNGSLPIWLSPIQVAILSISDKHNEYAENILKKLKESNIRVELNSSNETLGKKIRTAEMQKIPYLLVIGDKEIETGAVAVRARGQRPTVEGGSTEASKPNVMKIQKFIEKIKKEIENKIR